MGLEHVDVEGIRRRTCGRCRGIEVMVGVEWVNGESRIGVVTV